MKRSSLWWVNTELNIYIEHKTKLYNSKAWKVIREEILNESPFCSECNREANEVDHIKSLRKIFNELILNNDLDRFFELGLSRDNLRPICSTCNKRKSYYDGIKPKNKKGAK